MRTIKYRVFYMFGIGLAIAFLFKLFLFRSPVFFDDEILFVSIITVLLWEGNLQIDCFLSKKIPWITSPNQRIVAQIVVNLLYTTLVLIISVLVINYFKFGTVEIFNHKLRDVFLPTITITFLVLIIDISNHFLKSWKESLLEIEKYKTENAIAQLHNLKSHLNPHFLFNNLSVLTSLVYKNQDKAADFINELAKVYRYVLDTKNSELIVLQEELEFLNHYIYLQKIRFEDSIIFEIKIEESNKLDYIIPMCLQMVVENTIQHNEASQANPLKVLIYTQNNSLIIENQIKSRSNDVTSSKTGLKNIELRYSYFTDEKVIVSNNGEIFKVILPLIFKK
jgi:two-component system LytT family sensor kinase